MSPAFTGLYPAPSPAPALLPTSVPSPPDSAQALPPVTVSLQPWGRPVLHSQRHAQMCVVCEAGSRGLRAPKADWVFFLCALFHSLLALSTP